MQEQIVLKVFGKWILAGEYSVLRSHPALVFPLFSQFIEMNYQKGTSHLQFSVTENHSGKKTLQEGRAAKWETQETPSHKLIYDSALGVFKSVLDKALKNIGKSHSDLKGVIQLNFCISFGSGMGASAVICVLVGRLFHCLKWLKKEKLFSFCHSLENSLHGRSSGLDIAAVLTGQPLSFLFRTVPKETGTGQAAQPVTKTFHSKEPQIQIFHPFWTPSIFLSYSDKGGSTKVNIEKMKLFWEKEPKKAEALDTQMTRAVLAAKKGLSQKDKEKGLVFLVESFSLAEECFLNWNLIGEKMKEHILYLKKQGALAVKPTGSGSGGYVLSLWADPPPTHLSNQLISVFLN